MNKTIIFGIVFIIFGLLHFVFYKNILKMQGPNDIPMETRKRIFIISGLIFVLSGILFLVKAFS